MPTTTAAVPETREFLLKVIDVLLDFVKATNDRNEKVLEFHHPEDMKRLLDLDVPDKAVNLQQLIEDCATTLKYQVKTGKFNFSYLLSTDISFIIFVFSKPFHSVALN